MGAVLHEGMAKSNQFPSIERVTYETVPTDGGEAQTSTEIRVSFERGTFVIECERERVILHSNQPIDYTLSEVFCHLSGTQCWHEAYHDVWPAVKDHLDDPATLAAALREYFPEEWTDGTVYVEPKSSVKRVRNVVTALENTINEYNTLLAPPTLDRREVVEKIDAIRKTWVEV